MPTGILKKRKRRYNYIEIFEKSFAFLNDYHFERFLKFILKRLHEVIEDQEYKWKPLSEQYLEWKHRTGLDERTLIATGQYLEAIQIRDKNGGKAVGLPDGDHVSLNWYGVMRAIDYRLLAKFLEFGTSKMPARPHWRPVQAEAVKEFNQTKKQLVKDLKSRAKEVFSGIKSGRIRVK